MGIKKSSGSWFEPLFFIAVFCVILTVSLKYHSKQGVLNWKSEIFADRAGYYVFLPATFYFHWDLKNAQPKVDEKTGYGFVYDYQSNKIRTKYSCGLAIPIAPFFISVHYFTRIFGIAQDKGFAPIYHRMTDVSAAVYLVLGLFLMFRFLRKYFSLLTSYLVVFFILAGTNLYYYSVYDVLMTHVYNFAFVALYLLFFKKYLDNPGKYRYFIISCLAVAMLTLIRPTSILLSVIFILLDVKTLDELKARITVLFRPKHFLVLAVILFLGFTPQLMYNRYVSGQFFHYLYDDSFANIFSPRLAEVWFSTMNGLFIYTPLMFLVIAGMILMVKGKAVNAWISIILFLLLSYAFASWTCWYFGCSFGQRSFIDVLPVFAIPFAFLIEKSFRAANKAKAVFIMFLLVFFSYCNISLANVYEECFFGSTWDWNRYAVLLHKAKILPFKPGFDYYNDYENAAICNGGETTTLVARSGNHSLVFNPGHEFNSYFVEYPANMVKGPVLKKLRIKVHIFKTSDTPTGAFMVCDVSKDGKNILWYSRPLDVPMARTREWYAVPVNFDIPKDLDPWAEMKVYIWNKEKVTFYADDLEINAE